jgi:hypothetical protein
MGKSVADAVLDAALNHVKSNGDRICICDSEPTTYSQAITSYKLADKSITVSTSYTGPAAGGGSPAGRKLTVNLQNSITVDTGSSAQHVAIVDVGSTALLYVTTCTLQPVTASNTVNMPAWDIDIDGPT